MVKIYTFSDKRPDFIHLQNKYFKKFLKDEHYEFIICNNASNPNLSKEIATICTDNNLLCLDVDKDFTDPAIACEVPINSCIKRYISNDNAANISVIIDSDIFLFAPFSFESYIDSFNLAGIVQQREKRSLFLQKKNIIYLWNALLIFKNSKIDFNDFNLSIIPNITDVGGGLYNYLMKHQPKVKWMKHTPDLEQDEKVIFVNQLRDKYENTFGMQVIEDCFIHYYKGSNWNNDSKEFHDKKTGFLKEFLQLSETFYPLNISNTEAFNNISAHARKHYNGIRNNRNNTFNPNKAS